MMTMPAPTDIPETGGLKLLAIGDVHLGTRPSSLPEDIAEMGVSPSDLTPEAALSAAVDLAIAEEVDAVLLAGDVVESTNARFEALRPLEAAVRRLSEAAIPVLAVVGNHDVEALPRIADRIEGLSIVGRAGTWESRLIEKDGKAVAEILGWSFPEQQVKRSPVAELIQSPIPPNFPGLPRLGLLHADLDASGGNYAPISRNELLNAEVDAWLLGHIHKPSLGVSIGRNDPTPYGYLGSLVSLGPGEAGPHGPWLITVEAGQIGAEHVVNSPLRWEYMDVQIGESEDIEDTADRILDGIDDLAKQIHDTRHLPRLLGVRVHLIGRTQNFDSVQKYVSDGKWRNLWRDVGPTAVFVDEVTNKTSLAVDLEELAKGQDPPALLARQLLNLSSKDSIGVQLIEEARVELKALAGDSNWSPLQEARNPIEPLGDEALALTLIEASTAALYATLRQRQAGQAESETA